MSVCGNCLRKSPEQNTVEYTFPNGERIREQTYDTFDTITDIQSNDWDRIG